MDKLSVIIDNCKIELPESGLELSGNYGIENVEELEYSRDNYTKTIKLPGTKANMIAFGFIDDINVTGTVKLYNQKQHIGLIEYEGSKIIKGRVKLLDITGPIGNKTINIQIIGNSKIWLESVKEKKLSDLTIDVPDHIYTKESIEATEQATLPYVYPLINTRVQGKVKRSVAVTDFDPFLFVKPIVDKIFLEEGHQVVSEFFNSYFFKRLIMSARIKEKTEEYINARKFKVGLFLSETITDYDLLIPFDNKTASDVNGGATDFHDENEWFSTLWKFFKADVGCATHLCTKVSLLKDPTTTTRTIVGKLVYGPWLGFGNVWHLVDNGQEQIVYEHPEYYYFDTNDGQWHLKPAFVQFTCDFEIRLVKKVPNSWPIAVTTVQSQIRTLAPASQQNDGVPQEYEVKFDSFIPDPNDEYGIQLHFITPEVIWGIGLAVMNTTTFFNEISNFPTKGELIKFAEMLPEWTVIDFLKALKQLFNLKFLTDVETRTVYIEPRDQFYRKDSTINLPWPDISKDMVITDLGEDVGKNIIFKYKDDPADTTVAELNKTTGTILAQHTAENKSIFAEDKTEIENPIFAATLMQDSNEYGMPGVKLPTINSGVVELERTTRPMAPRILFYAGIRQAPTGTTWNFESEIRNDYAFSFSVNDQELNPNSLFFNTVNGSRGLFEKHYYNQVKTINEGRRISAYFNIDNPFIENFININQSLKQDYRAKFPLILDNEHTSCRLESINDFDPTGSESTNIVLIKDVDRILLLDPPKHVHLSPHPASIGNSIACLLTINFDIPVLKNSGWIRILNGAYQEVEKINIQSGNVTITGSTATIIHNTALTVNSNYFVTVDPHCFVSQAHIGHNGISIPEWRFKTSQNQLQTQITFVNNGSFPNNYYQNVGYVSNEHPVFFMARGSVGSQDQSSIFTIEFRKLSGKYRFKRSFINFDTSTIPDNAVITEATLRIYCLDGNATIAAQKNGAGLLFSNSFEGVEYGHSSFAIPGQFAIISFNAQGLVDINKTGRTKIALRQFENDYNNVESSVTSQFRTYLHSAPAGKEISLTVKYIV